MKALNKHDPRTWASTWQYDLSRKRSQLPIHLYKQFVKTLCLRYCSPEAYRIYLICITEYYKKSGVFNINDLLDRLPGYGFLNLDHAPGNLRKRTRDKLIQLFKASGLFEYAGAGNWKFISQDRLGRVKSGKLKITADDLRDKRRFRYLFYSMLFTRKDETPITIREFSRISGISRSHSFRLMKQIIDYGIMSKDQNVVISGEWASWKDALNERKRLYREKRLVSPMPIQRGNKFVTTLFMGNSYHVGDAQDGLSKVLSEIGSALLKPLSHRTTTRKNYWFKAIEKQTQYTIWGFTCNCNKDKYVNAIAI